MDVDGETDEPAAHSKALVLVDWHWRGHHPTYFAYFVLALERLQTRVLALCPHPEEAERAVSRLREVSRPVADSAPTEFRQLPQVQRGRWLPSRLSAIKHTIEHFRGIELVIREWQAEAGINNCEIFYSCMYEWDFDYFKYAQPFLRLPWSGLYIRPTTVRNCGPTLKARRVSPQVDRISGDKKLKALAILDEGIEAAFAQRVKRPVVVFPDFTDESMPNSASEFRLSDRLRLFAGSRPVVALFGHLQRSKGLTTFCAAAQDPSLADVCFAAVGDVDWLSFTPEERRSLQKCLADSNNVWTHLARVPDEPRLNGALAACSVLFAGYIDFPHSSNILTKAAVLEKPVVVSEGSLMAERVRRFRLGEIVRQEDPEATAAAILRITRDVEEWVHQHKPDWQAYRQLHSFEALKVAFARILSPGRTGSLRGGNPTEVPGSREAGREGAEGET